MKSTESGTVTEYCLLGQDGLRRVNCEIMCEAACPNDVLVILYDTACAEARNFVVAVSPHSMIVNVGRSVTVCGCGLPVAVSPRWVCDCD